MKMPIFIFYHIYAYENWEGLVIEQLKNIKDSGIYDACLSMFISFVGDESAVIRYYELIKEFRKVHTIKADNINDKEYDAIHAIWYLAQEVVPYRENENIDAYVLYFHTKGIHSGRAIPFIANRMEHWRLLMEHFVIKGWRDCIGYLNDPSIDAVGCNYRVVDLFGEYRGHFSGNFWMTKLSYLRKLSEPKRDWDILYNEFWIGFGNPKVVSLHESNVDHYREDYPPEKYYGS
jgi:hypothetical protein